MQSGFCATGFALSQTVECECDQEDEDGSEHTGCDSDFASGGETVPVLGDFLGGGEFVHFFVGGGFAVDDFDALVGAAVVAVAVCARVGGSVGDADALDRHDEWSVIQTKKLAAASLHVNTLQ